MAVDEAARLEAVRRYDILETPPDGAFDHIAAMAARLLDVPIAIISIVDEDRIWFKSHHGIDAQQIERAPGLCASAILRNEPWIVTDAGRDPRTLANPLVAGEFGLRFYLGVPLTTRDNFGLGTLCVIDKQPREPNPGDIETLKGLARLVMDQLELRLEARRAIEEKEAALRQATLIAQEIDHRVMNSLQLVSALLGMQGRSLGSSEAAEQLSLAAIRVNAIADVHRYIYQTTKGTTEARGHFEALASGLRDVLGLGARIGIVVDCDDVEITSEQATALGLIAAELVTNAVKHDARRIVLSLKHDDGGRCTLAVSDNGVGLPADFALENSAGLGMKVISSLVGQIGGDLRFASDDAGGARFSVEFDCKEPAFAG